MKFLFTLALVVLSVSAFAADNKCTEKCQEEAKAKDYSCDRQRMICYRMGNEEQMDLCLEASFECSFNVKEDLKACLKTCSK